METENYSDEKIKSMLSDSALYIDELRMAARQRGMDVASRAPMFAVISYLRCKLNHH